MTTRKYVKCPKCRRYTLLRKNGNLAKHRIPRHKRNHRSKLPVCSRSNTPYWRRQP